MGVFGVTDKIQLKKQSLTVIFSFIFLFCFQNEIEEEFEYDKSGQARSKWMINSAHNNIFLLVVEYRKAKHTLKWKNVGIHLLNNIIFWD